MAPLRLTLLVATLILAGPALADPAPLGAGGIATEAQTVVDPSLTWASPQPATWLRRLAPEAAPADLTPIPAQGCCRTCRKGKACGDSCIARDKSCTKPPGCACDG